MIAKDVKLNQIRLRQPLKRIAEVISHTSEVSTKQIVKNRIHPQDTD